MCIRWTPELVAMLGTMIDRALAAKLGCSSHAVYMARRYHHVPCFKAPGTWTAERVALLGTAPDAEIAARIGINHVSVAKARMRRGVPAFQLQKPWTAEELAFLGTTSDAEVAERVGRSQAAVRAARHDRGIKLSGPAPHPHLDDIKREYTTTDIPVREIGFKYGVSPGFVLKRAHKRGWARPDR